MVRQPKNLTRLEPEIQVPTDASEQVFYRAATPFGLILRSVANSPPRFARRVRRSLRSLLTAFRPFGAPSPLFATPLGFRPHPASKRGRSTSLSERARFAGVLHAMGSRGGGREREENRAILRERVLDNGTPQREGILRISCHGRSSRERKRAKNWALLIGWF